MTFNFCLMNILTFERYLLLFITDLFFLINEGAKEFKNEITCKKNEITCKKMKS